LPHLDSGAIGRRVSKVESSLVIALAGRRIDAVNAAEARFPERSVPLVERRLTEAFADSKATTLVCAAACGADLLALAVAGKLGLRRCVVLPADVPTFRASSVVDRPGAWGQLFDVVVAEVEARGDLWVHELGADDEAYRAANRAILDHAQQLGGPVEAWVVWNGRARDGGDITLHFAEEARARKLNVRELSTLPSGTH